MGPRSIDRGNGYATSGKRNGVTASMGPRSIDRGNTGGNWKTLQTLLLQWGRDQLIAEMEQLPLVASQPEALQWGRDQLIAEMAGGCGTGIAEASASMGPRSIDRGNVQLESLLGEVFELQWGRDQLIAEMAGG